MEQTATVSQPGVIAGVAIVDLRVSTKARTRTLIDETTMTDDSMARADLIEKGADVDPACEMPCFAAGRLMEVEVRGAQAGR